MYRNDIQLTVNHGIGGAIRGIKSSMNYFEFKRTKDLKRGKISSASAAASILRPIQQEIYNLMALSIQGHFEKSFRRWLRNSLQFIEAEGIGDQDIVGAGWANRANPRRDLDELMLSIRGVRLRDTIEGPALLELALLSNVVRHGDGPSARQAFVRYPHRFTSVPEIDGTPAYKENEELPERLNITEHDIAVYAHAAFRFWHRVQFAFTKER